ncbi:hypothetical protein AQ1_00506 [alpha proteobacterium Q-1]|nr:hypothetical protein AQ1_00506 [alpha proteobacterium Q-1]
MKEGMQIPVDHPERFNLNDEVHARPPEPLPTPCRVSYLALYTDWHLAPSDLEPVTELARRFQAVEPRPSSNHYSADFGRFRLRWERHTEYTRYTFIAPGVGEDLFAEPAIQLVPEDWLQSLPGSVLVAKHATLVRPEGAPSDPDLIAARYFGGNVLLGSDVGGGAATAFKDFRIHGDRFSRLLMINRSMSDRQAGRMMQRLFEIDSYRLLALLALPTAQKLGPILTEKEHDLVSIISAMAEAGAKDEGSLLDRLTRLQVELERRISLNSYRFDAARAYYQLVNRRIEELREQRYPGIQNLREFTERRLQPAMNTCETMARRQQSLSERVARTTQLLSTRVDIDRQQQNQSLLKTMSRRARIQLRMQQTVEGLSVAAITYYIVGLVGYLAKGLHDYGIAIDPSVVTAASIPFVLIILLIGVGRLRRHLFKDDTAGDHHG